MDPLSVLSRFPFEINSHVFLYCLRVPLTTVTEQDFYRGRKFTSILPWIQRNSAPLNVSHVCRVWRRHAFQTSGLWCNIDVIAHCRTFRTDVAEILDTWIPRSVQRLLVVQFRFPSRPALPDIASAHLLLQAHRWEAINVTVFTSEQARQLSEAIQTGRLVLHEVKIRLYLMKNDPFSFDVSAVTNLFTLDVYDELGVSLHNTTAFEVETQMDGNNVNDEGNNMNTADASVVDAQTDAIRRRITPPYSNLTNLRFLSLRTRQCIPDALQWLRNCPTLEAADFCLTSTIALDGELIPHLHTASSLKKITVHDWDYNDSALIFTSLCAPALTSLCAPLGRNTAASLRILTSFIQRSTAQQNLLSLTILQFGVPLHNDIRALLSELSGLRILRIGLDFHEQKDIFWILNDDTVEGTVLLPCLVEIHVQNC